MQLQTFSIFNLRPKTRKKIQCQTANSEGWCNNQHTCLFLAFCSLLSPSSSSSTGRLSSAASCRRNSHRHCTGSTSKDPSLDWTKSANHGMDWEEACEGLKNHYSYTHTHTLKTKAKNNMSGFIYVYDQCFSANKSTLKLTLPSGFSGSERKPEKVSEQWQT